MMTKPRHRLQTLTSTWIALAAASVVLAAPAASDPPTLGTTPVAPAEHCAQAQGDAPEISQSPGEEGGVIILWPRIVPGSEAEVSHQLAARLQSALRALVARTLPERPIDVRPEPERVCRRAGCLALRVGALLARRGDGCVVVAVVGGPGPSPARLVPWVGRVQLQSEQIPFREPPESHLTVLDFARCDDVLAELGDGEPAIAEVLSELAAGGAAQQSD
jgi:hypothetical protein